MDQRGINEVVQQQIETLRTDLATHIKTPTELELIQQRLDLVIDRLQTLARKIDATQVEINHQGVQLTIRSQPPQPSNY